MKNRSREWKLFSWGLGVQKVIQSKKERIGGKNILEDSYQDQIIPNGEPEKVYLRRVFFTEFPGLGETFSL